MFLGPGLHQRSNLGVLRDEPDAVEEERRRREQQEREQQHLQQLRSLQEHFDQLIKQQSSSQREEMQRLRDSLAQAQTQQVHTTIPLISSFAYIFPIFPIFSYFSIFKSEFKTAFLPTFHAHDWA